MDGQSERTIQILEDMLRAYCIDWGGSWEQYLAGKVRVQQQLSGQHRDAAIRSLVWTTMQITAVLGGAW